MTIQNPNEDGMASHSLPDPFAPSKLRLHACDRRNQILAAALKVFAEQGFHGTRTRELAERAGVSEALVFHHFPTKEALIRAIFDQVGFQDRIQAIEDQLGPLPPREALTALGTHLLEQLRDSPEKFRVVFSGLVETPHLANEFYRMFLSRLLALETRLFARAFSESDAAERAQGRTPRAHPDPAVAARAFHGALLFYNIAGAVVRIEPLPREPRALAEAIVSIHLPEACP